LRALGFRFLLVALEHVAPEGLYLLNVPASAIHWNASQQEALGKLTFKANLFRIRAFAFVSFVLTKPKGIRQSNFRQYAMFGASFMRYGKPTF